MADPGLTFDDRTPPQNIEAEEAILGGILLDPEAVARVAETLKPDMFYVGSHQEIYKAALQLNSQGLPTDLMSLAAFLRDNNTLEKIGGAAYLRRLLESTVNAVNVDQYAKIVLDKWLRRRLIQAGQQAAALGYDTGTETAQLLDKAEQHIFEVTQGRIQRSLVPVSDILMDIFSQLEARNEKGEEFSGIPSNFYDLDAMTQGFQPSDLIIVAARPAMGKCLAHDMEITLSDGSIATIADIYERKQASLWTLDDHWQLQITQPSVFVDDGVKPVYRVTTRLGRTIETTLSHPFLTMQGWLPLEQLKAGVNIAVPHELPVFGKVTLEERKVKILSYLVGNKIGHLPECRSGSIHVQKDFTEAVTSFANLKIYSEVLPDLPSPVLTVIPDIHGLGNDDEVFADNLKTQLKRKAWDGALLARKLGIQPALVRSWLCRESLPNAQVFENLVTVLDIQPYQLLPQHLIQKAYHHPLQQWLKEIHYNGQDHSQRVLPAIVFQLKKPLLALLLNRLFAVDGTVLVADSVQISYLALSKKLAYQIQHLLLRFGIIAALKKAVIKQQEERHTAWQLDIKDFHSLKTLIEDIGILGKDVALAKAKEMLNQTKYQKDENLIPLDIWQQLAVYKGNESWETLGKRAGIKDLLQTKRPLPREQLFKLATALNCPPLQELAHSAIYWDEIAAIESVGEKQVYDLTIPETHNFIAQDMCVHNTSFCLSIGYNIASLCNLPVICYSLEMSKEQLVQRLLCSEAEVDSHRLRSANISEIEWQRLGKAMGRVANVPLFIDDSPSLTLTEMRSKSRRLKAEQNGRLGMVLIDYLQLMEGGGDNRVQEISRITRGLKAMARELQVPVMALSQLSRGVESRTNKRPMLSDLRESGSIEQDADIVIMLYRDEYYNPETQDRNIAEVIIAKHRNGPVGTAKLLFQNQFTRFKNMVRD